jgi:hypothetical protein
MAQTGFTPILIYSSSTASNAPVAANLTNSALGSELAINITDGKLFYKDNANVIQVIGWKVVPATAGGTGQTSYAVGDILYANTTTTLAKLADVATGNALISGGVGVAPSWEKIGLTTHVSGVLPVANGGTDLTSFTANGLVYASSTSALATGSAITFDGTNFATTGTATASKLIPTGSSATGNGLYLPAANALGLSTNGTNAVYIDSSQNVMINTANASLTAGVGFKFIVSATEPYMAYVINSAGGSNFHLYNTNATNNGFRFYVTTNGGIANYSANNTNLSDERTKTDIQNAGSYLAKICAIPVRTFKYKDQADDLLNLGVIAQEVESIAPELVDISGFGDTPEDGIPLKSIYQTDLQYALMKSIQEQQVLIQSLTERIKALESR